MNPGGINEFVQYRISMNLIYRIHIISQYSLPSLCISGVLAIIFCTKQTADMDIICIERTKEYIG